MIKSYLGLNFDAIRNDNSNRFADGANIKLVNLGPIAFFSNYMLTTNSGKHLLEIIHGHIVSLMKKLLTSAKGIDDLSIGFDRDPVTMQKELTSNKNVKGKCHVRIMLRDGFGLPEH